MIEILEHATILSRYAAPTQGASAWGEGQSAGNQEPGIDAAWQNAIDPCRRNVMQPRIRTPLPEDYDAVLALWEASDGVDLSSADSREIPVPPSRAVR